MNLLKNASQSFQALNQHLDKNALTGRTGTRRGIRKGMNKTEQLFARILDGQKHDGDIVEWRFEPVKIKIGEGCWYCPDFMVIEDSLIHGQVIKFIEVKGFLRDDARVKFLAAQEQHKWATFEMYRKTKQGWKQIL